MGSSGWKGSGQIVADRVLWKDCSGWSVVNGEERNGMGGLGAAQWMECNIWSAADNMQRIKCMDEVWLMECSS